MASCEGQGQCIIEKVRDRQAGHFALQEGQILAEYLFPLLDGMNTEVEGKQRNKGTPAEILKTSGSADATCLSRSIRHKEDTGDNKWGARALFLKGGGNPGDSFDCQKGHGSFTVS